MTAKTSQHLADVLRDAGFEDLAKRAERDEFHDFLSPHATPELLLAALLADLSTHPKVHERQRIAAHMIRQRLIDGEFDASLEESDAWAESPEGQAAFRELFKGEPK
jgi:hypothetical protein